MTDEDIRKYAVRFRIGLIGYGKPSDGQCFVISAPLAGALQSLGVDAKLTQFDVKNFDKYECHYAIMIGNKLLDPTYDQIAEQPKVYLGKVPSNYLEV